MIEHIIFFKVKSGKDEELHKELRLFCKKAVAEIDGVEYASAGENFCVNSGGHTHGMIIRIRDRKAMESYIAHPIHKKIAGALPAFMESRIVVDYET
jgi:hypothetical protein